MYLIGNKRTEVINLNNVLGLSVEGKSIVYRYSSIDRYHILARYENEDRAIEVWNKMLGDIFSGKTEKYIEISGIQARADYIAYYLPTE